MPDPLTVAAIAVTFLIAVTVKGVIGLDLPTVSLALLTVAIDLPTAMALLLVPSFVTNLWQAMAGGHGRAIVRRLWPLLLLATAAVWLGVMALTRIDLSLLSGLLGVLLVAYAAVGLAGASAHHCAGARDLAGCARGRGERGADRHDRLVRGAWGDVSPGDQAFARHADPGHGVLFTLSTLALAAALQANTLLTPALGSLSAAALLPALAGMVRGQRIRAHLSEQRFRRLLFIALLILGSYIIAGAS